MSSGRRRLRRRVQLEERIRCRVRQEDILLRRIQREEEAPVPRPAEGGYGITFSRRRLRCRALRKERS